MGKPTRLQGKVVHLNLVRELMPLVNKECKVFVVKPVQSGQRLSPATPLDGGALLQIASRDVQWHQDAP